MSACSASRAGSACISRVTRIADGTVGIWLLRLLDLLRHSRIRISGIARAIHSLLLWSGDSKRLLDGPVLETVGTRLNSILQR